jgi:hypothetical protein
MGFTKRYINKEMIISKRKCGEAISQLFTSECVICLDDFSYTIFQLHNEGATEDQLNSRVLEYIHIE